MFISLKAENIFLETFLNKKSNIFIIRKVSPQMPLLHVAYSKHKKGNKHNFEIKNDNQDNRKAH